MNSQYLDFVSNKELKLNGYMENDILVYTKKTKKRLLVGFIRKSEMFPECKFQPTDYILLGKHCLLALSRFMSKLDKGELELI